MPGTRNKRYADTMRTSIFRKKNLKRVLVREAATNTPTHNTHTLYIGSNPDKIQDDDRPIESKDQAPEKDIIRSEESKEKKQTKDIDRIEETMVIKSNQNGPQQDEHYSKKTELDGIDTEKKFVKNVDSGIDMGIKLVENKTTQFDVNENVLENVSKNEEQKSAKSQTINDKNIEKNSIDNVDPDRNSTYCTYTEISDVKQDRTEKDELGSTFEVCTSSIVKMIRKKKKAKRKEYLGEIIKGFEALPFHNTRLNAKETKIKVFEGKSKETLHNSGKGEKPGSVAEMGEIIDMPKGSLLSEMFAQDNKRLSENRCHKTKIQCVDSGIRLHDIKEVEQAERCIEYSSNSYIYLKKYLAALREKIKNKEQDHLERRRTKIEKLNSDCEGQKCRYTVSQEEKDRIIKLFCEELEEETLKNLQTMKNKRKSRYKNIGKTKAYRQTEQYRKVDLLFLIQKFFRKNEFSAIFNLISQVDFFAQKEAKEKTQKYARTLFMKTEKGVKCTQNESNKSCLVCKPRFHDYLTINGRLQQEIIENTTLASRERIEYYGTEYTNNSVYTYNRETGMVKKIFDVNLSDQLCELKRYIKLKNVNPNEYKNLDHQLSLALMIIFLNRLESTPEEILQRFLYY
ncbi:hypothetical protein AX774_g7832 [Zancudomyces culisetae]|uniref:Uncharacterized protein n=1 Tax=Zancudomyces culisetae TaxID=1213189 RepID=A0A1R1PCT1_ZANCU|nr:hypothetical protein AX774_g7832 [Zancudomyces culisetae]|eukprot:OMH78768.1 hypothetical protein AX774_g7832 [Zancudomyces culisetae]